MENPWLKNRHRKPKHQTQASHSAFLMALSETLSLAEGSKIERARFCCFLFPCHVLSHSTPHPGSFEPEGWSLRHMMRGHENIGTQINTDKHGLSRRHRERGGYILTGFAGLTGFQRRGERNAGSESTRSLKV